MIELPLEKIPNHLRKYFRPKRKYGSWVKRRTKIWHKSNVMPSSVKDDMTLDFEYVYHFVKNKKYYFEQQFEKYSESYMKENRPPGVLRQRLYPDSKYLNYEYGSNQFKNTKIPEETAENYGSPRARYHRDHKAGVRDWQKGMNKRGKDAVIKLHPELGRNKRCVWQVNTKPFKEAHFAVFPAELIRTPIKACCPKGGVVLDPFVGSGTTAIEAITQGKNYIGIDLNDKYVSDIAEKRIREFKGLFNDNRGEK